MAVAIDPRSGAGRHGRRFILRVADDNWYVSRGFLGILLLSDLWHDYLDSLDPLLGHASCGSRSIPHILQCAGFA